MEAFALTKQLVQQGLTEGAYPAAVLAVGVGETLCALETYGDCREETLFDLASVSKVVSATMIALRFLEMGKIRLSDRVGQFFPQAPADKREITLQQLMTHTGGISPFFFLSKYAVDAAGAVDAILSYPLVERPGQVPKYSCMGYILLGKILEQVGQQPLDLLAQQWVFAPLGMTHTTYHPQGDTAPTEWNQATGQLLRGTVHDENARFLGGISGNAGVFSTIGDMARFAKMLALGGSLPGQPAFLAPQTLAAARKNDTPQGPEYRGLGFHLAGSPGNFLGEEMSPQAFGHTGFTGTSFAIDPETGLWLVLLTNRICPTRDNLALIPLRRQIHNAAATDCRRYLAEQ